MRKGRRNRAFQTGAGIRASGQAAAQVAPRGSAFADGALFGAAGSVRAGETVSSGVSVKFSVFMGR